MSDDVTARLIALRDRWRDQGCAYRGGNDPDWGGAAVWAQCANEIEGLITALRQDPRSEQAETED